jgi:hypothetical protein
MTNIVEVFWNARPHLNRMSIKVGAGPLDPRAAQLFQEVRAAAASAFPGCVTLVRIAVRRQPETELRVVRRPDTEDAGDLRRVRALIAEVVGRFTAPAQAVSG